MRHAGVVAVVIVGGVLGYVSARRPVTPARKVDGPRPGSPARGRPDVPRPGLPAPSVAARPVALKTSDDVRVAQLNRVAIRDLFDGEARDPRWAAEVEAVFADKLAQYEREVVPYATSTSFTCRASACQMSMMVPVAKAREASDVTQSLPLGRAFQPVIEELDDAPDQVRVTLTVIYPDDQHDVASIRTYFETGLAQRFPRGFRWVRTWLDEHPDAVANAPERAKDVR